MTFNFLTKKDSEQFNYVRLYLLSLQLKICYLTISLN